MAIPIIAAIGTVGAGLTAAAAATTVIGTVAAYATIAGGVLTGIGAVTGKKSLMKIGAVLAIGGGLATMANNWANSAATATSDAAGKVAVDATKNVVEDAAPSAAQVGTEAVPVPADVARAGGEIPGQMGGAQGYTAAGMTTPVPTGATAGLNAAPSLGLDAAAPTAANASTPLAVPDAVAPTVSVNGPAPVSIDPYQQYQSTMMEAGQRTLGGTAADSPIQQWLNKITGGMKAVGGVIKDNKELIQLGGQMLGAAYGPQAEQIDMLKAQQDRQVKNLNTPVKLYYRKG
jgi:hypothetical protein